MQANSRATQGVKPQFASITSNVRGRHWLSADTFEQLIIHQKPVGVGVLPFEFRNLYPNNPKQAFQLLNELTAQLRHMMVLDQRDFTAHLEPGKPPIHLQYVDCGTYGQVYRLTLSEKSYALKIYHHDADSHRKLVKRFEDSNIEPPYHHGSMHEQGTGLYLSDEPLKDLARFHFGNPSAGWAVSEWIEPNSRTEERPGKTLYEKIPGIILGDHSDNNSQGEVRVDVGGIAKPKNPYIPHATPSLSELAAYEATPTLPIEQLFNTIKPEAHHRLATANNANNLTQTAKEKLSMEARLLAGQFRTLPEAWRLIAFKENVVMATEVALLNPASLLGQLNPKDLPEALTFIQEQINQSIPFHPCDSRYNAKIEERRCWLEMGFHRAFQHLSSYPASHIPILYEWGKSQQNPDIQALLYSQINLLPEAQQMDELLQALDSGNIRMQNACAFGMGRLTGNNATQALEAVYERLDTLPVNPNLPEDQQFQFANALQAFKGMSNANQIFELYQAFIDKNNPHLTLALWANLHLLPKTQRLSYFKTILNNYQPVLPFNLGEALSNQILMMAKEDQAEARTYLFERIKGHLPPAERLQKLEYTTTTAP